MADWLDDVLEPTAGRGRHRTGYRSL